MDDVADPCDAGRRGDLTQEPADTASVPDSGTDDESVREVLARLYDNGRSYAAAEIERQKLRAGIIGAGVRDAVILVLVAVMLLFATLVAFLIGLIIALAPALTPLGATGAVLGSALLVALILLVLARSRLKRMQKATKG